VPFQGRRLLHFHYYNIAILKREQQTRHSPHTQQLIYIGIHIMRALSLLVFAISSSSNSNTSLVARGARASSSAILELSYEKKLWSANKRFVIGCDEAGRGPIAGPVVAAALVCLQGEEEALAPLANVADSKTLSEKKRLELYELVVSQPTRFAYAWCRIEPSEIDETNILKATLRAMQVCIEDVQEKMQATSVDSSYALIDGNKTPTKLSMPARALVKGDALCYSIALASIIAKTERDKIMYEYSSLFPEYGFDSHKGYPTKSHILALGKHGACPIHRKSFKPVKGM